MAIKKPNQPQDEQNPQNPQAQMSPEQAETLQIDAANLQQAQALMQKQKEAQQESINKSHDTEFTPYANVDGANVLDTVTKDDIDRAYRELLKYKEEKTAIEKKIIENEEFWKMNHWDVVYKGEQKGADKRVKPKSAWLFNLIINKHADAMDNYPEANILPRARDDEETAKVLSEIIPVILEQNNYEDVYSDAQWYKCKNGTSVQAVLWNNDKNNGLGDVEIKKIDILNLFWKGGISDIQDSPNLFHVQMMANSELKAMYPNLDVGGGNILGITVKELYNIESNDTDTSAVIDWYYKKRVPITDELGVPKMNTVLHYCKFCNGQIIYASENDPNYADRGWYDHGEYPFVFDTLYPIEGSVCGIGYIDIEKDDQIFIDKLQQAILESAITNARPRYFIRNDGQVNENEFLDLSSPLVHIDGSIGGDNVVPIENSNFSSVYEDIFLQKIEELKDTSGNTASSQGQTSSVTSASGIASLQEAAGKLSRDMNTTSYRAYKKVVNLVIELMRQFYNEPRCFRIVGEDGSNDYATFDNRGLLPQAQGQAFGIDLGNRLPIMDIDVKPEKRSAYTKAAQNETALNLYNMGFFAPNNADASLACLNMMEFDQIDKVKDEISQNGTLYQQVQQLMQQNMMLMATIQGANPQQAMQAAQQTQPTASAQPQGGGSVNESKGSLSTQAASATRGSTAPR